MTQLFRYWLDLCLLRAAPQDGPASTFVLGFSLTCYIMISVMVLTGSYGMLSGAQLAFLDVLLMIVFVAVMLSMTGKAARIIQTLSAAAGAGCVIGLVALPLVLVQGSSAGAGTPAAALSIAGLLLTFWNLAVSAHIIRHALSVSFAVGVAIALLYVMISLQLATVVLPVEEILSGVEYSPGD